MKKTVFIPLLLILFSLGLKAQYAEDALRFSEQYYQGTARSMATGGAFGALGADISVLSTNPAGLGLYRSRVYSFTPEVYWQNTSSLYNGGKMEDSRTIFDISSFGMVNSIYTGNKNGFKYFQFAFGLNRLNNFNMNRVISGNNLKGSRLDAYLINADGINYQEIENDDYGWYAYDLNPAWNTFLLDTIPGTTNYYYTPVPYGGVLQTERVETRGSVNEWEISVAGNYEDKLYMGITLGLPYLRYYRESWYNEKDVADTIPYFNSWSVYENLATKGMGINIKVGLIFRPVDWLRVGGAFHSPTWYSLSDSWYTIHNSDFEDGYTYSSSSPDGYFEYNLHTPLRAIGDVAFIIKKQGFITFEYEYADYSLAKFKADGVDYATGTNADIKNYYQATNNFRGGIEYRPGPFSLRAGYAYYASPYQKSLNDGSKQVYSGGVGYTVHNFSIDFAFVYSKSKSDRYLYSTYYEGTLNPATVDYGEYHIVTTLKYRF